MVPSIAESFNAPPGYSSQRTGTSPPQSFDARSNGSTEDLVSAQTHPHPQDVPAIELEHNATSRHSENNTDVPRRRRYSSLPDATSSVGFPMHLRYPHDHSHEPEPIITISPVPQNPLSHSSSSPRHNPTNYISLSRKSTPHKRFLLISRSHSSITGAFTINPYLHIPDALLLSPRGGRRKNLRFEVQNGGIDVDIFLVGGPPKRGDTAVRTTLDLEIRQDSERRRNMFPLIAKIHTPGLVRPPFHLTATGIDGYHALHLPASFHGLVTIDIAVGDLGAHISLSRGFVAASTILTETPTTRSYFVGALGGWARDKQGWEGDRVDVGVRRGKVRVQILGERAWDGVRKFGWAVGL